MSHIKHSFLVFVGEVATSNPRTWIYSFMAVGIAIAIALYGALGLWLGGLFGHATEGMYLSYTLYGYWFLTNVEELKSQSDLQISNLEEMRALLDQ